jgi:hypothetical protein
VSEVEGNNMSTTNLEIPRCFFGIGILLVSDLLGFRYFLEIPRQ